MPVQTSHLLFKKNTLYNSHKFLYFYSSIALINSKTIYVLDILTYEELLRF